MRKKIISLIWILLVSICIFTSSVFAAYDLNEAIGSDLKGKTKQEAEMIVKQELAKHGYQGDVRLNTDGTMTEFNWESSIIVTFTEKPAQLHYEQENGQQRYVFTVNYNGEEEEFSITNTNYYIDNLNTEIANKINETLTKKWGVLHNITANKLLCDIRTAQVGTVIVRETNIPEKAYITIEVNERGKISTATATTVAGGGVGTKERPDWYMDRLHGSSGDTLEDPVTNPDSYEPGAVTGNSKVFGIANILISIIKWIGVALSVIILMVLGIKYLTGSIEEKAEYKKTMVPYVVGCMLLFAGSFIVQIIYDMVTGM